MASIATEYLNLSFDEATISQLPPALTSIKAGLIERLRSRRSTIELPPGFDDEPAESSGDKSN